MSRTGYYHPPATAALHTPAPWQINHNRPAQVCDADGQVRGCSPIARCAGTTSAECHANAARIVACVNACEGIATDLLAGFSPGFLASLPDRHHAEKQALMAANDRLANAIRLCLPLLEAQSTQLFGSSRHSQSLWAVAASALIKAGQA